jgi:hypothetical protein
MAMEGRKPEKLIPTHLSAVETTERRGRRAASREPTPQDLQKRHENREEALSNAPPLEEILRDDWKQKAGEDAPENRNLSLDLIDEFRIETKRAQSLREGVKEATEPAERARLLALYNEKRKEVTSTFQKHGPSFEKSYRDWMRERMKFYEFLSKREELVRAKAQLSHPDFKSVSTLDPESVARIEDAASTTSMSDRSGIEQEILGSLATIYGDGSEEYTKALGEFRAQSAEGVHIGGSKPELRTTIEHLSQETQELWQDNPMVRYFYGQKEMEDIIEGYAKGADVMETQSVIRSLNTLWQWEQEHRNTTVGGILVGPPGVGKTTLLRHYLDRLDRGFVYVDLSEDVTRYLLYGSKNIEFKNTRDQHTQLISDLKDMNQDQIKSFVVNNAAKIAETLHLSGDEATAVTVGNFMHEIEEANADPATARQLQADIVSVRDKLQSMAEELKQKDIAYNLLTLVKKNGWRDGVVISALRNDQSIIFDEFNKNKNWSLIYGLITAKPGEQWYFADNDEWIDVPKDWRMYFTANIGRRHGVFEVPEALASRAEGKVMEIGYPPRNEEISVALASLANSDGDFLRSRYDLAKLVVLINEVFPRIREYTKDKRQAVPISYRTIRNLGEKLVRIRDPQTGAPVYQPTNKSFDEALYEVLIGTYALYEDKSIPTEIADMAASAGLMLDPEVKDRMTKLIGETKFKQYEDAKKNNVKAFNDILKIIQGLSTEKFMRDMTVPISAAASA